MVINFFLKIIFGHQLFSENYFFPETGINSRLLIYSWMKQESILDCGWFVQESKQESILDCGFILGWKPKSIPEWMISSGMKTEINSWRLLSSWIETGINSWLLICSGMKTKNKFLKIIFFWNRNRKGILEDYFPLESKPK